MGVRAGARAPPAACGVVPFRQAPLSEVGSGSAKGATLCWNLLCESSKPSSASIQIAATCPHPDSRELWRSLPSLCFSLWGPTGPTIRVASELTLHRNKIAILIVVRHSWWEAWKPDDFCKGAKWIQVSRLAERFLWLPCKHRDSLNTAFPDQALGERTTSLWPPSRPGTDLPLGKD